MQRSNTSDQLSEGAGVDGDGYFWHQSRHTGPPTSPMTIRRMNSSRTSDLDLRSRRPARNSQADERSGLLGSADDIDHSYASIARSASVTPRPRASRRPSIADGIFLSKSHSRSALFSQRLVSALSTNRDSGYQAANMEDSRTSASEHRVWYDQVGVPVADGEGPG